MKLHREGKNIILITLFALLLVNAASYYFLWSYPVVRIIIGVASLVFLIMILQFFRFPKRDYTRNDSYVICPADGKVVVIEKTYEEEYFKDERIQVSIFMSPVNVHANWYPVGGRVKFLRYHKGKTLVAWHPKSSTENERTTVVIQKDNKTEILIRQVAGALANRIICYPQEGDIVRQCAELGFIKFGSRVDVYLPLNTHVNVGLGRHVKGGVDVLAMFE